MNNSAKAKVEIGFKQTEVGLIPEDWKIESLGDLCSKVTDGTHDTPKPISNGIPFLTALHVKENRIDYQNCYFLPDEIHNEIFKRCNPEKNDVLMVNIGAGVGTTALIEVDYEFSLKNVALLKVSNKIDGSYLNNTLIKNKSKILKDFIAGGAQPFLSLGQISKIQVPLPATLHEQKAIATALSDVDEFINSLEKLIAKKKAIKQGAMQELLGLGFDSAQSITPRKRLHGFSGDWEERKLGDCLLENPKYGINAAAIDYDLNYPTYLRITDINDNGNLITSGFKSVNHADSSSFYIEKGDIVFARTGASVGKSYIHDTKNGDFVYAGFLIRIKVNQKILNPSFLSHYVRTKTYWNWVQVMSMRSGQPGINGNEFASFQISFPPVKEQKAIAKILNDMDLEIGSLETKTEKYKSIKDGMMQELLTGKIRLV